MTSETQDRTKPKRMGATTRILASIILGLAVGLFFGERVGWLQVIGDVYVGLLQMTVLPFVVVSLVANIGRFSIDEGRALAKIGSLVLLLLFAVSLAAILVLPLSFPRLEAGAFFSVGLIETREPPDFFDLYIPSNPFYSLSENLVPAAVLFSILLGVALAGVAEKQKVLSLLDVMSASLGRVNKFVVRLTPIGVFAIAGAAAGTMTIAEFGRLQAYFAAHTFGVVLMTFLVVPLLVAALTPLSYRKIIGASQEFLITAWATGSLFAVLPMLIQAIERLLEEEDWDSTSSHATPGVLVPLGYPFPTVGKLLALVFVPFVAWFLGTPLGLDRYPVLLSAGLFSSFGSLVVTIPFLLQLMELPSDFFNLFLMAGVWSARLGDLAGGMHLMAFSLLCIAGLSGRLRLDVRKAVTGGAIVVVAMGAVVLGTRTVLARTFPGKYAQTAAMQNLHQPQSDDIVTTETEGVNPAPLEEGQSRLSRARERGTLRIGYPEGRLPFSFRNQDGDLVGFDIDLAREFGSELGLDLELVPYDPSTLLEQLGADHFDLAIGGLWGTVELAGNALFTEPYLIAHAALLVKDHERAELDSVSDLVLLGDALTVAVSRSAFLSDKSLERFPEANIVEIENEGDFFGSDVADALVTTAEGGSAWTLAHPDYGVVLPVKPAPRIPLVMVVGGNDLELQRVLNVWIRFQESQGTTQRYFDHWIRGGALEETAPRWSVGRDLLGLW